MRLTMVGFSEIQKMKVIKPTRLYMIICFIVFIFMLRFLVPYLLHNSTSKELSAHLVQRGQEIDFSRNLLLVNSAEGPDPFVKGDYLNKKLLQLVSSSHLASLAYSGNAKNASNTSEIDFSYLLDELMSVVKLKNFFGRLWGCKEADSIQVQDKLYETKNSIVYPGVYKEQEVNVEVARADIDVLINAKCGSSDADKTQQSLDRCFLLKNRRILDEAALLIQLSHSNIARILGLCIQRVNAEEKQSAKISSTSGVILIREAGSTARVEKLKTLSWENRLKVSFELLSLAVYFSNTPLGSVRLENWNPANFIINSQDQKIQLSDFDQLIYLTEPACSSDVQCFIDGINSGIKCSSGFCEGYNAKRNLFELNQAFLSPLLRYNVPQKLSETVLNILVNLNNLKISASDMAKELKSFMPKLVPGAQPQDMNHGNSNKKPGVLNMGRLPDGWQVDSWEQHEAKVAINEVNLDAVQQHAPDEFKKPNLPVDIQHFDQEKGSSYQKIEHADYPGRYDYYCPRSKAEWGCVMSLRTAEDAMRKCSADDKCKAFVTIPHLRKEGWIIAILKSDNSNPVDHAGTTVYIRQHLGAVKLPDNLPLEDALEGKEVGECLKEVISSQSKHRSTSEESLMKSCGWSGVKDDDWSTLIKESRVSDATKFKPARGKLANGGQMNIILNGASDQQQPALFLAKRGPEEFDVSQLAVYQLDRMLGLYKTPPAIERQLTSTELIDAGFPLDVGGSQFDNFRPIKQTDGSLIGVVVPQISVRATVEHYMSVPRLSGITNAVTPFNKRQWNDLEYLLLGFLADIPIPNKGHQSVQGRLLHLRTEEAFLRNSNDYISYLYNCQFPSHVIDTLRYADAHRCDLGRSIRTRLLDDNSPRIVNVIRAKITQLLELVDQCISRFGKRVVLYDTQAVDKR